MKHAIYTFELPIYGRYETTYHSFTALVEQNDDGSAHILQELHYKPKDIDGISKTSIGFYTDSRYKLEELPAQKIIEGSEGFVLGEWNRILEAAVIISENTDLEFDKSQEREAVNCRSGSVLSCEIIGKEYGEPGGLRRDFGRGANLYENHVKGNTAWFWPVGEGAEKARNEFLGSKLEDVSVLPQCNLDEVA